MTVRNLIQKIFEMYQADRGNLGTADQGSIFREAQWLVEGHLFNLGKIQRRELNQTELDLQLVAEEIRVVEDLAALRVAGKPLAQLIQFKEFYSLPFFVNEHVLIPRPETEILVEMAIEKIRAYSKSQVLGSIRVADLGTGSGCIGLTIAHKNPNVIAHLFDISPAALMVAKKNSISLGIENKIEINLCDLSPGPKSYSTQNTEYVDTKSSFRKIERDSIPAVFDLVVSNPPYIPEGSSNVESNVHQHEPHWALYGGQTGTRDIENFFKVGMQILKPKGFIGFEIGWDQGEFAKKLFFGSQQLEQVQIIKDYSGLDRFVVGTKKE